MGSAILCILLGILLTAATKKVVHLFPACKIGPGWQGAEDTEHRAHLIGSCLDLASPSRGRLAAAFDCSLSADAPCLLAGKAVKTYNNNNDAKLLGHLWRGVPAALRSVGAAAAAAKHLVKGVHNRRLHACSRPRQLLPQIPDVETIHQTIQRSGPHRAASSHPYVSRLMCADHTSHIQVKVTRQKEQRTLS